MKNCNFQLGILLLTILLSWFIPQWRGYFTDKKIYNSGYQQCLTDYKLK